jgi:hypothetical protein
MSENRKNNYSLGLLKSTDGPVRGCLLSKGLREGFVQKLEKSLSED